MNVKMIIGLASIGSFIGGVMLGCFATKKYWKNKYEERYQEDREMLYAGRDYIDESAPSKVIVSNDDEGKIDEDHRVAVKEVIKKEKSQTDYTSMYGKHVEKAAKRSDKNDAEEWTNESIQAWHEAHKDDGPVVIDYDDIQNLPPNIEESHITLYYYDNTLIDEEFDDEITDPELIFGGCLDNFYDNAMEEERIVVLNAGLDSVYIVNKVMESYDEYNQYDSDDAIEKYLNS